MKVLSGILTAIVGVPLFIVLLMTATQQATVAAQPVRVQTPALPACDTDQVQEWLIGTLNVAPRATKGVLDGYHLEEIRTIASTNPAKRWCRVFYYSRSDNGNPYYDASYTLEWIDQTQGRYSIEVKSRGRSACDLGDWPKHCM